MIAHIRIHVVQWTVKLVYSWVSYGIGVRQSTCSLFIVS